MSPETKPVRGLPAPSSLRNGVQLCKLPRPGYVIAAAERTGTRAFLKLVTMPSESRRKLPLVLRTHQHPQSPHLKVEPPHYGYYAGFGVAKPRLLWMVERWAQDGRAVLTEGGGWAFRLEMSNQYAKYMQ